jgi:nitroreductase/NAD-dependent dihydropyrimidine dehydrogenase PreA subunit
MAILTINPETCTKCGLCITDCPVGIIGSKNGDYPETHRLSEKECLRCGHCVAICPNGSLSHREMPVENCPPIKKELIPSTEQVTQLIRSRRSVRSFQNKVVPREVISRAIEIARYAPTGHNDQDVEWIVINSPPEMKQLTTIGADWLNWMIKNQPQVSAMFNFPRMVREYENGHDKLFREAPVVIMTHAQESPISYINCIVAMSYFDLAAQNLGLGCCWCGFALMAANGFSPMKEYLKIPDSHWLYGCLLVGYQLNKYQRLPDRKAAKVTWR